MSIEHIHETSQHREYEYRHHPCHLYHRVSILCYEIHYNYYAEQLESTRYIDISVLKKNNPSIMIANWTTTRKHVITILLSNLFSIFFIYFLPLLN